MALQIDNCRDKWEAIAKWEKTNKNKQKLPARPTKAQLALAPDASEEDKARVAALEKNKVYHDAKYSRSNVGRCEYSSWTDEGLEQFAKWRAQPQRP